MLKDNGRFSFDGGRLFFSYCKANGSVLVAEMPKIILSSFSFVIIFLWNINENSMNPLELLLLSITIHTKLRTL